MCGAGGPIGPVAAAERSASGDSSSVTRDTPAVPTPVLQPLPVFSWPSCSPSLLLPPATGAAAAATAAAATASLQLHGMPHWAAPPQLEAQGHAAAAPALPKPQPLAAAGSTPGPAAGQQLAPTGLPDGSSHTSTDDKGTATHVGPSAPAGEWLPGGDKACKSPLGGSGGGLEDSSTREGGGGEPARGSFEASSKAQAMPGLLGGGAGRAGEGGGAAAARDAGACELSASQHGALPSAAAAAAMLAAAAASYHQHAAAAAAAAAAAVSSGSPAAAAAAFAAAAAGFPFPFPFSLPFCLPFSLPPHMGLQHHALPLPLTPVGLTGESGGAFRDSEADAQDDPPASGSAADPAPLLPQQRASSRLAPAPLADAFAAQPHPNQGPRPCAPSQAGGGAAAGQVHELCGAAGLRAAAVRRHAQATGQARAGGAPQLPPRKRKVGSALGSSPGSSNTASDGEGGGAREDTAAVAVAGPGHPHKPAPAACLPAGLPANHAAAAGVALDGSTTERPNFRCVGYWGGGGHRGGAREMCGLGGSTHACAMRTHARVGRPLPPSPRRLVPCSYIVRMGSRWRAQGGSPGAVAKGRRTRRRCPHTS
jgi:hypothetical protein